MANHVHFAVAFQENQLLHQQCDYHHYQVSYPLAQQENQVVPQQENQVVPQQNQVMLLV